ncbi:MAG: hypothetical protein PHT07_02715, partial [Paludibacter sp.]|nr:hypothetical protein [Paludibacter sp.]
MKNIHPQLFRSITILLFVIAIFHQSAVGQKFAPLSPNAISDYNYTIANDVQVTDRVLEFDLFVLDTDPTQPFEMAAIQAGITVDPAIYNGGTITVAILPGTSQFTNTAQYPSSISFVQAQNIIRIAAKPAPGTGFGSIISTTAPGTRVCRLSITNTVPFTVNSRANLTFNFTTIPYPTKIAQYVANLNTVLVSDASNCFSNATNMYLNQSLTPIPFAVTGTGSVCLGAGGLPVGLASSQVGVTYTLYNGATPLTPTVAGTGAAISFGNQLAGTYTVQGTNASGTANMIGNAVITEDPIVPASVTIAPSANNVCAGTSVTFTPTPIGGGTAPTYQWYKNTIAVA